MYYPKNQIETNLYSRDELVFANTTQYYTGFYFKTSDGQYFTGKEPNDGPNNPLTLPPPDDDGGDLFNVEDPNPSTLGIPSDLRFLNYDNEVYSVLTNQSREIPFFPIPYYPVLTKTNKTNGYFTRYFVKKANENVYTEINKQVFEFSKTSSLYIPISLNWVISGNRNKVFDINQKQTLFTEKQYKIIGLGKFLNQNYLEFYQG